MTKFNADTNIIIRYSKPETKAQIIAILKADHQSKAAIVSGDLVIYGADRGLVDTLLGLADVRLYGVTVKNDTAEITDSNEVFGVDVAAEFLAAKAEYLAELEAKADAVDALLGATFAGEGAETAPPVISHFEVSFGGKEFNKCLREVKKVEGARFDGTRKVWTIPATTSVATREWLVYCLCTVTAVYGAK